VPEALIERDTLSVASADPAWREPFQARLEDLMARYRPLTELEIRPGLTLTYGEVVALAGDYYATPEELAAELTPSVAEAIRGVTPQDEGTFLLNTHRGWFDYVSLATRTRTTSRRGAGRATCGTTRRRCGWRSIEIWTRRWCATPSLITSSPMPSPLATSACREMRSWGCPVRCPRGRCTTRRTSKACGAERQRLRLAGLWG